MAIDAHNPDVLVAGANDKIDQQPCPRLLVTTEATCERDYGTGISGVYFSFDRGSHWTQPIYTGFTSRGCDSETPCGGYLGPIGRVPGYYENGLVDAGDPAVAIGPRPVDGNFSWANGSRVDYANIAVNFPGQSTFAGDGAVAVSRLDNPTPERVALQSSWMAPVIASKQSDAVFNDKPQIWADNAASSAVFRPGLRLLQPTPQQGQAPWDQQCPVPAGGDHLHRRRKHMGGPDATDISRHQR